MIFKDKAIKTQIMPEFRQYFIYYDMTRNDKK